MKKLILFGLSIVFLSGKGQSPASAFAGDSIVFYGLDFSNCRLIGDFGNGDGFAMKTKMFPQWNSLLLKEANKYDIYNAFNRTKVYYDFGPVEKQNAATDESKILVYNDDHSLNAETIAAMIKRYPEGDKKAGTGLVFVVEKFNKTREVAVVYVTLFDIASKKLLVTEPMKATPNGVGLRNYWAKTIYQMLKDIDMYAYANWKTKYSGK
jgi:hypothetical protein